MTTDFQAPIRGRLFDTWVWLEDSPGGGVVPTITGNGASSPDLKDTNPKDAIGDTKLPMHLVPQTGIIYETMAFLEGAVKYGKFNWRVAGVRNSIYLDAIKRHLAKYENGEDVDPKTLVEHLASIRACCNIILDARECGKLTDDRAPRAPTSALIDRLVARVAHLKQLFANHSPHQHTIEDSMT